MDVISANVTLLFGDIPCYISACVQPVGSGGLLGVHCNVSTGLALSEIHLYLGVHAMPLSLWHLRGSNT